MTAEDRQRFEGALEEGLGELALSVPPGTIERLGVHYELLVRWARRINLTTVTDPIQAAHLHGLDCLLFTALIDADAAYAAVDVGSGGGFPGVILAVARPQLQLTLLEPIRKRTSFLRVAIAELGLRNVRVVDGKLEPGPLRPPWPTDLVVSRATIPPLDLIELAGPVLRPGGRLILTAGQGIPPPEQVDAAALAAGLSHVARHAFVLPDGVPRWLDELMRPSDALKDG